MSLTMGRTEVTRLYKGIYTGSLLLLLVAGIEVGSAQQQKRSIRLFDATPTFRTGPQTSPTEAITFASTSVMINFTSGDTAVISSTPDGTGPIVIDNFMTINGLNVCVGVEGQLGDESCFGPSLTDPAQSEGDPIETVLTPIPPVDVSHFIPRGTSTVQFDLQDFGVIAGNTDLFLVTTATAQPPSAVRGAFQQAVQLLKAQLAPAVIERFREAFEEQVSTPILVELHEANADPAIIADVEQQLAQTRDEQAREASAVLDTFFDSTTVASELQRRLGEVLQHPAIPLSTVTVRFVADLSTPQIRANQSIDDILTGGFDPKKIDYEWPDLAGEFIFEQDGAPDPVSAPNINLMPKFEIKAEANPLVQPPATKVTATGGVSGNVKVGGTTVTASVQGQVGVSTGGAQPQVTVTVTVTVK